MSTEKQYGLIDPKSRKKLTLKDVFNNDSDSGDEHTGKRPKISNEKERENVKKQTKLEMQRAIEQDPTVYQYDEIYDEMIQKKSEVAQVKENPEKAPKYIQNLIKTAERRKKENERRLERQIQKEREAEGDMFKDKEEFITSSYKQKLEEFKKAEEEEQKREYIESVMDVSKQKDLGGFYRHLYRETVNDPNSVSAAETNERKQLCESKEVEPVDLKEKNNSVKTSERNYRKRCNSNSSDETRTKVENSSSSSDSESSSASHSSSSSSEEEKISEVNSKKKPSLESDNSKRNRKSNTETEKPRSIVKNSKIDKRESEIKEKVGKSKRDSKERKVDDENKKSKSHRSSSNGRDEIPKKIEKEEVQPVSAIWEKRTVGAVFEAAQQRYFQRKSQRGL